jgi:phenylpropionate dioxygenase-like ring-hydroxylating dioxygenase large terminal subunit
LRVADEIREIISSCTRGGFGVHRRLAARRGLIYSVGDVAPARPLTFEVPLLDTIVDTITFNTDDTATVPAPADAGALDTRKVKVHPDHWYPVAWSRELKPAKPLAVHFAGDPIVLVRPKEGAVFALENRCAHRQVPLDAGVVSGCAIRCGYHGWTYDASGKCIDVPYLGKGKLPNGVKSYPVREAAGLIFIFPGDPAKSDNFPDLSAAQSPAFKTRRFGREVACHYSFMHENLMDMNHQFLHRKQMGQIRPRYLGRSVGEDWLEVQYTFARTGGKQPLGETAVFGGKRTKDVNDKDVMTIRTEYPYQTLRILPAGGDAPVMDLWIVYVPTDAEQRKIRTFGLLSIGKPKGLLGRAGLNVGWPFLVAFTERIFKEDRWIVEAEQAAHDRQGTNLNQEVFPVIRELTALLGRCGVA